jgi:formylglycine-generating enzyme required for sulfatase activity
MAETSAEKLKVFISYSRRDSTEFADELVAGLELAGFAPFLDRHDIAAGEKWEERLGGLIEQADTVVFVISPEAVKSERCSWEVERTLRQSKRLLPVVYKLVPDSEIPEQLRERQSVRFDGGAVGFARPLAQLAVALRQDLDWIREHTRLGELAGRWEARGTPQSLLLRGDELVAAELWIKARRSDAPAITDLTRTFIVASKEAEDASLAKSNAAQRRIIRMQAVVTALLIIVIIGLVGWMNQSFLEAEWRWYTITRPYVMEQIRPYVLTAQAEESLKPGASFKECAQDCPEMVVVPAGSYTMGGPTRQPQHTVTFAKPFAVSKYEVTFDDWDACVKGGGCNGYNPGDQWGREQRPVINVDWYDAQRYVAWLSQVTGKTYRLLSESEYEYAARAGTTTAYPWGDDIMLNGKAMAHCAGCGSHEYERQTAPVGAFPPNKFGLYDMVGNVWEWVEDCVHIDYKGAPADGSAWIAENGGNCTNRITRGGSWNHSPEQLRSEYQTIAPSGTRLIEIGFRVARMLLSR